jgi:3-oxoacyl-[acyl-carrier-protein] synthase II
MASNSNKRVVITGVGLVTAAGTTTAESWGAIASGRSAVSKISGFDTAGFATNIAAEIKDYQAAEYMPAKDARRNDRSVQLAANAANQCLAGVPLDSFDRDRVGVVIGSGIGGIDTLEKQHEIYLNRGPGKVSPFFIPMMISDMAAGYVSIAHDLRGPNYATVSACASGGNAIADAYMLIRAGIADAVLTGGTEAAVTPMSLAGFCSVKALSRRRNDEPEKASRPFDAERDGFVLGEGAGILFVEELEHARSRGATIMAELAGVGLTGDAHHITAPPPDGSGAIRAMQSALDDAGMRAEDVDYINAHGTSTQLNDAAETKAIKDVFGDHTQQLMVSSTKSMIGHLLGAAASVEAILCVLALRDGILPPTINLDHPDPACDLDYIPHEARKADADVALTNSFGFGGHNVTLIIKRYDEG